MRSSPTALKALRKAIAEAAKVLLPPPDITVSEWADRTRIITVGNSPGQWRTAAYQREIMDAMCDPHVHEVVWMKSTQVGYSEILNNIIGYYIDIAPRPLMMVQPTENGAKDYGRKRIVPLINDTPVLRDKVREAIARKGGNTLQLKEFPGGFLKITGANSGAGLRSDPVPVVLFDEVDGYPDDVVGEGDPVELGRRRTDSYADYKIFLGSTPAKSKGFSRIEAAYEDSDKRRYHVPCPHCTAKNGGKPAGFQVLWWRDPKTQEYRLVFDRDKDGSVIKSSVRYVCAHCNEGIREQHKQWMVDNGHWIAEAPGREVVGFHINALYKTWKENWASLATEWIKAQGKPEKLRTFINLNLGETYEEPGASINPESLRARVEPYPAEAPNGVCLVTVAADVQDNRVEALAIGWGIGEESWVLAHEVYWGDPSTDPEPWEMLDALRSHVFLREDGMRLVPQITVVDSGDGGKIDAVYEYVRPRQNSRDRVYAIKGVPYHAKPILVQESATKKATVRLFTVGTHAAKQTIFDRLKMAVDKKGPGYIHFHEGLSEEFFEQLAGEKKEVDTNKRTGVKKVVWKKTRDRNEVLDMFVYNLACLFILQTYIAPHLYRDLAGLEKIVRGESVIPARGRRVLSSLSRY